MYHVSILLKIISFFKRYKLNIPLANLQNIFLLFATILRILQIKQSYEIEEVASF